MREHQKHLVISLWPHSRWLCASGGGGAKICDHLFDHTSPARVDTTKAREVLKEKIYNLQSIKYINRTLLTFIRDQPLVPQSDWHSMALIYVRSTTGDPGAEFRSQRLRSTRSASAEGFEPDRNSEFSDRARCGTGSEVVSAIILRGDNSNDGKR